jgi:hypothetical protein
MPAAHRLADKLAARGLLPRPLKPLMRVRFGLLEHLRELDTVICLPPHLAAVFGKGEIPASVLGENAAAVAKEAADRLESFKNGAERRRWQREAAPELSGPLEELERRRRELAAAHPKDPQLHEIWMRVKDLQRRLLERTLEQVSRDWQVRDLDYYDSRGALLPWCLALGGEGFYTKVITEAQVYEESSS